MRSFDDFAVRAAALSDTRDCDRGIGTFFFERNERPLTPICPASFGSMHERSFAVIGRSFAAACRRQKRFSY
ncbi:hypothetical protein C1868_06580 [Eggerthella lenta]|uniref:Uncharacterized protein n=1 Tax=Eggerthella lenta TaxID=84112 RepID=A0A369N6E5_EGGLN|nr:hypothetical protein C1871_07660 [Eggerthella lenta]RDB93171.1 hypothetical protein C1868_06580 [Eggerthella lenta]RDC37794.1 hypothetical protein C1852_06590 [Eggerthella lenta]RDC39725.1 hypothetical protein C1853_05525 [Eggerthella lenta]RGL83214.1 hypothetical protein DXC46_01495 [Eggerthella lenta]